MLKIEFLISMTDSHSRPRYEIFRNAAFYGEMPGMTKMGRKKTLSLFRAIFTIDARIKNFASAPEWLIKRRDCVMIALQGTRYFLHTLAIIAARRGG